MPKHLARWLLIFGLLLAAYYIYRAFVAITKPITDLESFGSNLVTATTNGIFGIFSDVTKLAKSIVGGETGSVSDNPTTANLTAAPLAPGQINTPTTILADNGFQVSPTSNTGGAYWDLLAGGIVVSPNDKTP